VCRHGVHKHNSLFTVLGFSDISNRLTLATEPVLNTSSGPACAISGASVPIANCSCTAASAFAGTHFGFLSTYPSRFSILVIASGV
jgi:hypothetical protein